MPDAAKLGRRELLRSGAVASAALFGGLPFVACRRTSAVSAERAVEGVTLLAKAARTDVEEVRTGLPKGAALLKAYFEAGSFEDAAVARETLDKTRSKIQDLRIAKSTFFALVDLEGTVIRSDLDHDGLAGKNVFGPLPELQRAVSGAYVETRGEMAEVAGVRGRKDGQWVAAAPVRNDEGKVLGLYVTGWSWSAYAYRLENQLRSHIRSALKEREKEPLVYVFVVVDADAYGTPIVPDVNAKAVRDQGFASKGAATPLTAELEITGREFGLAYVTVSDLGKNAGVAVLRSET